MAKDPVVEAVKRLRAEHSRTQSLDYDKVLSICQRRDLDAAQTAEVRSHLIGEGLLVDDAPTLDGWAPDDLGDKQVLDLMGLFLNDLERYRLLTAEAERKLSRRIAAMAELRMQLGESEPSPGQQAIIEEGQKAFEQFLLGNIRLVIWQARFAHRLSQKLDLLDLIQEGMFGLYRAVEKFDPTKGYKFSTYATWWVKQSLQRAVDNLDQTIRWPVHARDERRRVEAAKRRSRATIGRDPSLAELAEATGIDAGKIQAMEDWARVGSSLDAPLSAERGFSLEQTLVSQFPSPEEIAAGKSEAAWLQRAIAELDDRSAEVIRLRFGLGDRRKHTLEEIGQEFGVTRERIRQIESKTLAELRRILGSPDSLPSVPAKLARQPESEPDGEFVQQGAVVDAAETREHRPIGSDSLRPLEQIYSNRAIGVMTADRLLAGFEEHRTGLIGDHRAELADHVLELIIAMNAGDLLPAQPDGPAFADAEVSIARLLQEEQNRDE